MRTDTAHKTTYLKDYTPYHYTIESLDLNFEIFDGYTLVTAVSKFKSKSGKADEVFLNGENLELLEINLDGNELDYKIGDDILRFTPPAPEFTLHIKTKIYPEKNTRLEGLYKSGDTYCTQCEAEGFRHITYFPDRPDVLTLFTVRVEADAQKYPVLLSNGHRIDGDALEDGRHFTLWEDPYPKPCYLFALVAGDLEHVHDTFTTRSGRDVDLYIYVRKGDEKQCDHAMTSLKNAMKWDEEVYGLEYELDIFNIVAVSDFNMGAMENTSLNIFNTALVLAQPETATDKDYIRVESVIAHEYFHNWSGNRVTCRDWFQLSLKEGLTVFRDQEFSSDLNNRDVQRIDDVIHLRRFQFPEDSSPLAHPIRPDNYIEINNFYTMTVYEKGAEVIRMMRTIIGEENYRKGTDLYFSRHDGQAVRCEDFVACMEEASDTDLSHFKLWYAQAGTPDVHFKGTYDAGKKTYKVELSQKVPDTAGQINKKPMFIPIATGLLGKDGKEIENTRILPLTQEKQEFTFENIAEAPVASVLRGFSAPVKIHTDTTLEELAFLALNDTDGFNAWEAGQKLCIRVINDMLDNENTDVPEFYLNTMGEILERALKAPDSEKALFARKLTLPDVDAIGQIREALDPPETHKAVDQVLRAVKRTHRKTLDKLYTLNRSQGAYEITPEAMGQRALQNIVLNILTCTGGTGCRRLAKEQYDAATNMTDRLAALSILARIPCEEADAAMADFHARFKGYPLVIDKWFAVQASAVRNDIIERVEYLGSHADFNIKNPNRVRSLYAAFGMNNPVGFHAADGSGYKLLADAIIELDEINPQIAARMCSPFRSWQRYSVDRQKFMKDALARILEKQKISPNLFEIAKKSLDADKDPSPKQTADAV